MTVLFVCAGDGSECWNCGGWVHCDEVPEGEEPIGGHYCSTICHDEGETLAARERARLEAVRHCCPTCGFDNQEHDEGCTEQGSDR